DGDGVGMVGERARDSLIRVPGLGEAGVEIYVDPRPRPGKDLVDGQMTADVDEEIGVGGHLPQLGQAQANGLPAAIAEKAGPLFEPEIPDDLFEVAAIGASRELRFPARSIDAARTPQLLYEIRLESKALESQHPRESHPCLSPVEGLVGKRPTDD